MANDRLEAYVRQQISAGYSAQAVKQALVRHGYSPGEVDQALSSIYNPSVKHVIHFSPTTLIGIAVVFIGIVSIGFLFMSFFSNTAPEQLLDLSLEPVETTVTAGSDAVFISEVSNMGSSNRYDIYLKYEVINSQSQIVTSKQETRAVETIGSKQARIQIPDDARPGSYTLRAIATYNDQRAVATLPVRVTAAESTAPIIEPDPVVPDPIDPIEEDPVAPIIEEPKEVTETSSSRSTFEVLEEVERIARSDKNQAERLCTELELQTSKDLCFNKLSEVLKDRTYCKKIADERTGDICLSNIAKLTKQSGICEEISKDNRKDSCYMNFIIEDKDYTVCIKVTNQYLRQSCESLRQLSELNVTDLSFYESILNASLIEFI